MIVAYGGGSERRSQTLKPPPMHRFPGSCPNFPLEKSGNIELYVLVKAIFG